MWHDSLLRLASLNRETENNVTEKSIWHVSVASLQLSVAVTCPAPAALSCPQTGPNGTGRARTAAGGFTSARTSASCWTCSCKSFWNILFGKQQQSLMLWLFCWLTCQAGIEHSPQTCWMWWLTKPPEWLLHFLISSHTNPSPLAHCLSLSSH